MARKKKTVFFSRNYIKIEKYSGLNPQKESISPYTFETTTNTSYEKIEQNFLSKSHKPIERYSYIRKKSPLGFYYTSRIENAEYYNWDVPSYTREGGFTVKNFIITLETEQYILSYPIKYKQTSIGIDSRPWDIAPHSTGMPDHMIQSLLKEVNKFINILYDYDLSSNTTSVSDKIHIKNEIFIDLFGFKDGPKIQPNDIKILSHGFDLKTSFRRPKENK